MANIDSPQRREIVKTGRLLQGSNMTYEDIVQKKSPKVKYSQLQKCLAEKGHSFDIRTVKLWWDRRGSNNLVHSKRTGRPIHEAFRTESEEAKSYDRIFDTTKRQDQKSISEDLRCSTRTLRRHTRQNICWVLPPTSHCKETDDVKLKRLEFIDEITTESGRLKNKFKNSTWIDHKQCGVYGQNRRSNMRPKWIGDSKKDLVPIQNDTKNPSLMVYFGAHKGGTVCHRHGTKRRLQRGTGWTVDKIKVDAEEVIHAMNSTIIEFMESVDSTVLFADCLRTQRTRGITDLLEDAGIELFKSSGYSNGHNGGYPPYSHPFMIQDHKMFGPFQSELSEILVNNYSVEDRFVALFDETKPLWESDKYAEMAFKCINSYPKVLQQVKDQDGSILGI